jgi:hypothetical protein
MPAKVLVITLVLLLLIVLVEVFVRSLNTTTYGFILDIANWGANLTTMIAVIVFAIEARNSAKSNHLEGATRLFERFDNEEAREGRKAIYLAFSESRKLTGLELAAAERTRTNFNEIGVMVREGLFPKNIALRMYSDVAIKCWTVLEDQIKEGRKLRNCPSWMQDFEWFYLESKKYRQKNFPNDKSHLYGNE